MRRLLIDFSAIPVGVTNDALELIHKAINDKDGGIWSPHESILIQRLVELFTQRGLDRLAHVKQAILDWEAGVNHKPVASMPVKPGMMQRWSDDELALVKIYLEALPPAQWTIDDHLMAVDYVVQRYLPADELATEAEWMATRANLMGKVQANMASQPTAAQADTVLAALPSSVAAAQAAFPLKPAEQAVMAFGKARAVENVRALSEEVRHKMRGVVMQHVQEKVLTGDIAGPSLESKLLDEFATLNRDWRRIAVTEAGECQLQGFIASLKPHSKVKRVEQYGNACSFCKKIHGAVAEVVPADHPDKDGATQIWPGKTNIGRSASPRKRVGDQLVPRTEDEMWWLPAGVAHPHCRGRWVQELDAEPGDDPVFADWLKELLS